MLTWVLIFLIIAIVAAVFGFTGIAAAATDFAHYFLHIYHIICYFSHTTFIPRILIGENRMDSDNRLQQIEARLKRIEEQLHIKPTPAPEPAAKLTQHKEAKSKTFDMSGNWLGLIGILCFVLAAGFIIKLSVDSGWLTPARQIGIAALFGLSLIIVGVKILKFDRAYTSLLPAAGIVILFLTAFSAHQLYFLISLETTMVALSLISVLSIFLYAKIKHDIYPVIAAIGAYIMPLFLQLHVNSNFTLNYFVVCSLTFAILSIYVKSRLLTIISAYFAILATAFVGNELHQDKLTAAMLALQFLIFSFGTFLYSIFIRKPMTEQESWSYFPILLIFYAAEYYFLRQIDPNLAAWVLLAFAAFLIVLYLIASKLFRVGASSKTMLLAFVSITAFHSGYLELLPDAATPWLFALIIFSVAFIPNTAYSKEKVLAFSPVLLVSFAICGIEYAKMIFKLIFIDENVISWDVITLAVISIWALFICKKESLSKDESFGYALLGAAHFMVILALYRLADPHGSLAVSISWLIYAIVIIIFAFLRKDKIMANSALIVLFFSAAKALIYDASSAPTVVRILCLISTGIVLYAAGYLYKKIISQWRTSS